MRTIVGRCRPMSSATKIAAPSLLALGGLAVMGAFDGVLPSVPMPVFSGTAFIVAAGMALLFRLAIRFLHETWDDVTAAGAPRSSHQSAALLKRSPFGRAVALYLRADGRARGGVLAAALAIAGTGIGFTLLLTLGILSA